MIRTNLSTRPFYNERAVQLSLLVVTALVVAASVFNVSRIINDSQSDTRLATQASQDEARATSLRAAAARLRASVNPKEIELASVEAKQANDLIDRRTFSWTELLNLFELAMPDNVRISTVRPGLDPKRGIVLSINVVAKSVDDVNELMEKLEGTGSFVDPVATEDHFNQDGQLEAMLDAVYVPRAGRATMGGTKR